MGGVYQQTQRWLKVGVFEAMVHDLRVLLRLAEGRNEQPSAAIFDSNPVQKAENEQRMMEPNGARGARPT